MTVSHEWWLKPRTVVVAVEANSWFDPFGRELAARITAGGDHAVLARNDDEVPPSAVAFYLSWKRLTPGPVLDRSRLNLVVHASALPKGRGWSPYVWQILEGETDIPITMFEPVAELDAGPVAMRETVRIEPHELAVEWRPRLAQRIVQMCQDVLSLPEPPTLVPQEGEPSEYGRRRPEHSRLDLNKSIAEQFDLLRVVDNDAYPAFFEHRGHRYVLRIEKSDPAAMKS